MTNITLAVRDDVYTRMRKYPEIKWSEFVRRAIETRLDQLERLDAEEQESLGAMLISFESFRKDWDNKQDARWDDV